MKLNLSNFDFQKTAEEKHLRHCVMAHIRSLLSESCGHQESQYHLSATWETIQTRLFWEVCSIWFCQNLLVWSRGLITLLRNVLICSPWVSHNSACSVYHGWEMLLSFGFTISTWISRIWSVSVISCISGEWRTPLALRPTFCSSSREITGRRSSWWLSG